MDFNNTETNGYQADQQETTKAAAQEPVDLSTLLLDLKKKVHSHNKSMAGAFLRLQKEIEDVRGIITASKLKAFLVSECGLNRSDVSTYLKFASVLESHRELVEKKGLPFTVIKPLVAAPQKVRDEAIERIKLGSFIHSSDISAIRRHFADQAKDPAVERERRRTEALQAAAERRAQTALEAFSAEFVVFAQSLVDFYNEGHEDSGSDQFRKDRHDVVQEAGRCLARFESIFDTAALPRYWEYKFHGHPEETVCLARAYESLRKLAAGELKAIDPEDCNPYDKDHDYLDTADVENVIWLFHDNGISAEDLKRRPVPAEASAPKATQPPYRLTSLEICAGAGGQTLGLHAAGFDALGLYERNPYAAKTLETNRWLGPVHCEDVTKVDFRGYRGDVDLVAGGVPCQPHSSMGKRGGRNDPRDLFTETVRIVEEVQPRAFFFENVKGFGEKDAVGLRADLFEKFAALGYQSQVFSFYGSDYGLAQLRPRIAFVGFRDVPMKKFRMPPKFLEWKTTVGEALLDIVTSNGWERDKAEQWARVFANKIGRTVVGGSEESGRQSFSANLRTQDWLDMGIDPMGIADKAPPAGHPLGKPFKFTLDMGAKLQGFPRGWTFTASRNSDKHKKVQRMQIANALPPVMAHAVGLAIYSTLTGVQFDYGEALKTAIDTVYQRTNQHSHLPPLRATGMLSKLRERRDLADYHRGSL